VYRSGKKLLRGTGTRLSEFLRCHGVLYINIQKWKKIAIRNRNKTYSEFLEVMVYITYRRERKVLRGTGTRQRVFGEFMMYSAHRRGREEEPEEQEQDEVSSWSLW
jgi:hypothetical protein